MLPRHQALTAAILLQRPPAHTALPHHLQVHPIQARIPPAASEVELPLERTQEKTMTRPQIIQQEMQQLLPPRYRRQTSQTHHFVYPQFALGCDQCLLWLWDNRIMDCIRLTLRHIKAQRDDFGCSWKVCIVLYCPFLVLDLIQKQIRTGLTSVFNSRKMIVNLTGVIINALAFC